MGRWQLATGLFRARPACDKRLDVFIVRAELMHLESYHWQGIHEPALQEAAEFVSKYGSDRDLLPDAVTARLILGERLQRVGRHEEALPHYEWIIEHCNGQEPWHGIETLARTHYRIFDVLCQTGADPATVRQAAMHIVMEHEDTEYAHLVGNALRQGFWSR